MIKCLEFSWQTEQRVLKYFYPRKEKNLPVLPVTVFLLRYEAKRTAEAKHMKKLSNFLKCSNRTSIMALNTSTIESYLSTRGAACNI